MHIAIYQSKLYVPEYTTDTLKVFANGKTEALSLSLGISPDAPSSIAVSDDAIAVADFYNNRIIFQKNNKSIQIGKEGHGQGELYYPTDVELYDEGRISCQSITLPSMMGKSLWLMHITIGFRYLIKTGNPYKRLENQKTSR